MDDTKHACRVLDLNPVSSLIVFAYLSDKDLHDKIDPTEFFWLDYKNPNGSGPFPTVTEAVEDWKSNVLSRNGFKLLKSQEKPLEEYDQSNVISIFSRKKK